MVVIYICVHILNKSQRGKFAFLMEHWPRNRKASGPHASICDPFFFALRNPTNVILGATPVPERFLIVVVFQGFPSFTVAVVMDVTL
jgi:hypothetical protein